MTGAEALQKILDDLNALRTEFNSLKESVQLIEANIKTLNNRAAGLMMNNPPSAKTAKADAPAAVIPQASSLRGRHTTEAIATREPQFVQEEERPGVLTYKKVFGKLINNAKEPIENVLIKVYDKNNEVCATTETDPTGYWEIMLKPGRYVAEYTKTGFKTTNKTFEVSKNAKETEVK